MFKFLLSFALWLIPASLHALPPRDKVSEPAPARVTVHAQAANCSVDLDNQRVGQTNGHAVLVLQEVEPGDHYLHLSCPGEDDKAFLISPHSGENVTLDGGKAEDISNPQGNPADSVVEARRQLPQLVQQAVQLRARGKVAEAAERLRAAAKLDPENSDLHRELGITFLLGKDWKRARVEMLEAIRHDPTDADAYNGLGYALEKMGDLNEAVKQYRMATSLDPQDPTYRTHYVDLQSKLSQAKAQKK
jgi:hypothetical protein